MARPVPVTEISPELLIVVLVVRRFVFMVFVAPVIVPPRLLFTVAPDVTFPAVASNSIVFAAAALMVPEFVIVAFVELVASMA